MKITFHTMSYPTARLVWHCPYFCIFTSSNGEVGGENYHEYLLLKMDGENWKSDEPVENKVDCQQSENFKGWKTWLEQNKAGLDCTLTIHREGNKVIMKTENSGISLISETTILDSTENLFLSLTGDQCAITNIRIS